MAQSSRSNFLKTSAVGAAAIAGTQALAQGQAPFKKIVAEVRAFVLGGSSEYMSSFLVGYFHAMLADIVAGSRGSLVIALADTIEQKNGFD